MELGLEERTAIVCGGSSGMGLAVAEALAAERPRDAEAHPRRCAADDRRPAAETEIHPYFFFRTPTTSRTAAAEARSIFFSSAFSLSLTISSIPPAPSRTGTPM